MKRTIRLRKDIYMYLINCLGKQKRVILIYVLILLLVMSIEILTPQLYNNFIDHVLLQGEVQNFLTIVLEYFALFILGCMGNITACILINKLRNTLEYKLRKQALEKVIYPKRESISTKEIGDIKWKIDNDICKLSEFLQEQFASFEMNILLMLASAICLVFLNWELALIGIFAIPVTLWLDYKISKKENILNEKNRQNDSNMSTWLYSVVIGWKKLKMLGQEKNMERRYVRFQHNYALYNAKWINYWVTRQLIIPKLKNEFLMEFGVYFLGGVLILKERMSVGNLLVFIVYYHLLTKSMTILSAYQASLQSDMPIYLRAMSWNLKMKEDEGNIHISTIQKVELKSLDFYYGAERHFLFKDINATMNKGDCIHIKGKSGSGKTTLVKLMLGLMEANSGCIMINERQISEVDLISYYKRVSGCLQNTYLFNTSIKENLLYAAQNASEDELRKACARAHVLEEILKMPDGFDTIVGDRGNRLSGGQCQRILLARAFLKNADIYFFDEVTSALDKNTSILILNEIKKIAKRKIVFLVSHDEYAEKICNKYICI
ncbi:MULTISPECIES: ABC transporter ATP-binding protein [Blautia]|uniref:ABC transporter ATP-binding protein n=1 Tax=Blautia TaxID=572511 RepID=UPI000BA4AABB|nr:MULTISPECIES: ABC transporter ATP-binding protein [Blautia]